MNYQGAVDCSNSSSFPVIVQLPACLGGTDRQLHRQTAGPWRYKYDLRFVDAMLYRFVAKNI